MSDFKTLILKSLASSEEFKANIKPVREEIIKQNKETIKIFLDTILGIIADKKATPTSRFYALYSLKVVTEHTNPALISQLWARAAALKVFYEHATFDKNKVFPERGSTFFNSKPSTADRSSGSNYIALLLEMIKYWNAKYGATEKGKDNPPKDLFKKLTEKEKVPFPETYFYYKPREAQGQPGQPGQTGQASQPGQLGTSQISKAQPSGNQPTQKSPPADSKAPAGGKDVEMIKTSKERINAIKHAKSEIKSVYENNEDALDAELLVWHYEDLKGVSQEISERVNYFVNNPSPEGEPVLNDLMLQNDNVDVLLKNFQDYSNKKLTWEVHKATVLSIFQMAEKSGTPDTRTPIPQQDDIARQKVDQGKTALSDQRSPKLSDSEKVLKAEEEKYSYAGSGDRHRSGSPNVGTGSGGKEIERTVSQFVPAKDAEKKISGAHDTHGTHHADVQGVHFGEMDGTERLMAEARKRFAPVVNSNCSDLYEDADYPDPKEEQKARAEESERKRKEDEKEQQRLKDEKAKEELRLKEERAKEELRLKEEKTKEDLRVKEEKAKEELRLKEEKVKEDQRIKDEKAREELRLKEEKSKEELRVKEEKTKEELRSKEEQRLKEEKAKEDQRLKDEKAKEEKRLKEEKAKEEQRVKEEKSKEDQRLKEEKAKEELRLKEEKAKEEQRLKDQKVKEEQKRKEDNEQLQKEQALKKSVSGSDNKTAAGLEKTSLTKNQSADGSNVQVSKANILLSPEYGKPMAQSMMMKVDDSAAPKEDENQNKRVRAMVQSFKLDKSTVAQRFAGDLKLMENSIKGAKERNSEMDSIKEGIKQSFINRNRKPPNYKELVDQDLLKNLEEQLQNLKNERLSTSTDETGLKPKVSTLGTSQTKETEAVKKLTSENVELRQKTDKLQKDCDKYQQDVQNLTKKIGELEQKMKQTPATSQVGQKSDVETNKETERLKSENRDLQERVKKLEQQLKELQQQQKQQQQQQQTMSPNKTENDLVQSSREAQELRDQMKDMTRENQWLQDTVNDLKKKNKDLHEKLVELEDLQSSVGQPRTDVQPHSDIQPRSEFQPRSDYQPRSDDQARSQPYQNGATAKTEAQYRQPEPLRVESPSSTKANIFRRSNQDNAQSGKPQSRNIFGLARELLASGDLDEYSDNARPQKSPQNPNVKTSSKQEPYNANGKDLKIQDLDGDSGSYRKHQYPTNVFQKSEFNPKDGRYAQLSRSPEDRLFSSPGNYNQDSRSDRSEGRYRGHGISESENDQDALAIKGDQVIGEIFVLKELKIRLGASDGDSSLQQFKSSVLKPKSLLFENDAIQIGVTASLVQDYASSKNMVKLMMYYGNKLNDDITNFRVSLTEGLNLNVVAKPQSVESVIAAGKQVKQQLLISFTTVPFSCLQLNCEGLFGGSYALFSFPLPNLLVKFMEFKYIEVDEFSQKWSYLEDSLLKTEPIQLDTTLVKSAYDFKKFFSFLIDLKPNDEYEFVQGKKGIKFGGLIELETPNVEYLLKINVLPSNEVVFQVATQRQHQATARYLLQTLAFLFRR